MTEISTTSPTRSSLRNVFTTSSAIPSCPSAICAGPDLRRRISNRAFSADCSSSDQRPLGQGVSAIWMRCGGGCVKRLRNLTTADVEGRETVAVGGEHSPWRNSGCGAPRPRRAQPALESAFGKCSPKRCRCGTSVALMNLPGHKGALQLAGRSVDRLSANGVASPLAWGNAPGKRDASRRALKARFTFHRVRNT